MVKAFVLVFLSGLFAAAVAGAVIYKAGPSTAELDRDIASVAEQIEAAKVEASQYTGGLLRIEAELRSSILKNTKAMLEQKRSSFLRGVTMTYLDPTPRVGSVSGGIVDLSQVKDEIVDAQREAARYTGGLLQTMALMREATAKVTLATIEQRLALARIGVPIPSLPSVALPEKHSPGKTVMDKDAL